MIVSVCLFSNLYYSLLGFFLLTVYLFAGLLLRLFAFCACLVYLCVCLGLCVSVCVCLSGCVPVCLSVCLSVWENDSMGFCLLFESIFILSSTLSNKSGENSTRPHGPLKICPKRVLSTCHEDNDNVSSAV